MDEFMENYDMSIMPEKVFASDSESENEDEASYVSKTFPYCKEVWEKCATGIVCLAMKGQIKAEPQRVKKKMLSV